MERKLKVGAYGKPNLATMKPVLQMSTNTAGMTRKNRLTKALLTLLTEEVELTNKLDVEGIGVGLTWPVREFQEWLFASNKP